MIKHICEELHQLSYLERKSLDNNELGALNFYCAIREELLYELEFYKDVFQDGNNPALLAKAMQEQEALKDYIMEMKERTVQTVQARKKQSVYENPKSAEGYQIYLRSV